MNQSTLILILIVGMNLGIVQSGEVVRRFRTITVKGAGTEQVNGKYEHRKTVYFPTGMKDDQPVYTLNGGDDTITIQFDSDANTWHIGAGPFSIYSNSNSTVTKGWHVSDGDIGSLPAPKVQL